jgi:hypothetical protein
LDSHFNKKMLNKRKRQIENNISLYKQDSQFRNQSNTIVLHSVKV